MDNQAGSVPLYRRLRDIIAGNIASGEWPPHSRIPSERELCDAYGMSRITVRHAVAELVNDGRLVRHPGRGTFVGVPQIEQGTTVLTSFTEEMRRTGRDPSSSVLRIERLAAKDPVGRALRVPDGSDTIVIRRLRLADGEPCAVETVHLPADRCASVLECDLEHASLYEELRARAGIRPARAEQTWRAIGCPAELADILAVPAGTAVLHINRTTFDSYDVPFEFVVSHYRGDRFVFRAELAASR